MVLWVCVCLVETGGARCEMLTKKRSAVPGCTVSRLGCSCGNWRESVLFCCPKKLQWSIFRGFLSNTWSSNQGSLPHPIDPHRSARPRYVCVGYVCACLCVCGVSSCTGSARERASWQTDGEEIVYLWRNKGDVAEEWQSSSLRALEEDKGMSLRTYQLFLLYFKESARVHELYGVRERQTQSEDWFLAYPRGLFFGREAEGEGRMRGRKGGERLAAVWRWCMQMIDDFTAGLDNSSKQIWLEGGSIWKCTCVPVWACMCLHCHCSCVVTASKA